MNIVLIDKEKQYIAKINQNRNLLKNLNLIQAIIFCFFNKGSIIYSKEEKTVLNFCEKILKIPYLYGKIESVLDFENHYAKIKRYEIPVLMYHQFVKNKRDGGKIKLFVTEKTFELQLKILKFLNYETITFEELKSIGLQNRFFKKYIILTVDDGYKDNYEILFPLLKKYSMKAVIFLVSGLNYNKWTIESDNEKKFYLMSTEEILEMQDSGLVEFGGHTLTHLDFHKAEKEIAEREIREDKEITEERLNKKLTVFAYPYGHRKEETKKLVKEAGYDFAVSTDTGAGIFTDDLYDIRRTAIDKTSLLDFLRKISPRYAQYKAKKYKNKRG
jgi:peptidoglycan/xylan/chitin deacetylase (PgdA/CDA1 family)